MASLTNLEWITLVLGLAMNVVRRGGGCVHGGDGRRHRPSSRSIVEVAVATVAGSISISGITSQFPHTLELVFDIFMFEAATPEGNGVALETLSKSLKELCDKCESTGTEKQSSEGRLRIFSEHLTKRLCQRMLGESDQMYSTVCRVFAVICGMTVRPQCGARTQENTLSQQTQLQPAPIPIPSPYVCWILEAVTAAMGNVGKLDIGRNIQGNYHIYRRLQPLCELLHVSINAILVHSNNNSRRENGVNKAVHGRVPDVAGVGASFSSMSSGESATVPTAALKNDTIGPVNMWVMNMLGECRKLYWYISFI